MNRLKCFAHKVSHNNRRTVFILKCDIKKFFSSINHQVLISILEKHIPDKDTIWLLSQIIESFKTPHTTYAIVDTQKGLPLGNLTSQLLVNVYMNEFDQFIKHKLKLRYYIRFADDFISLSHDKEYLKNILKQMKEFLENKMRLKLHPDKVFIKTLASGVDFLGWVHFPKHRVLRTSTKRKMLKQIGENLNEKSRQSYLGMLKHGNGHKLKLILNL